MQLKTHLEIDTALSGEVTKLSRGFSKVVLKTTEAMRADGEGLVHGGFCFSGADFAAMAAVNDPFVVLAKSEVRFIAPVRVGESIEFEAKVIKNDGKKQSVEVIGRVSLKEVFSGLFHTMVLKEHILS